VTCVNWSHDLLTVTSVSASAWISMAMWFR
jgi:hypothetical protein